ncbi:hypothetical protein Y032_0038g3567 [Ancylostoma ceylanicum]|uniref:Uncharacterized protein n=1 Tax=Ancylostoma ceylanicum TaxID=53326 RepID=A0A016UI19_9BILA|nr:hypothetical protein Y032_0038g3567 [Ancylostoma ceylanicum]
MPEADVANKTADKKRQQRLLFLSGPPRTGRATRPNLLEDAELSGSRKQGFASLRRLITLLSSREYSDLCQNLKRSRCELRLCIQVALLVMAFAMACSYFFLQLITIYIYKQSTDRLQSIQCFFTSTLSFVTPWSLLLLNGEVAQLFQRRKTAPISSAVCKDFLVRTQ